MIAPRAFRRGRAGASRRFDGPVLRVGGRRRRVAKAMLAAGWPRWRIALALRIPRSMLERMLAATPAELFWGSRAAAALAAMIKEAA